MSKSHRYALLTGILIIAIFLRFYHFSTTPPGLYPDEAMEGDNGVEAAQTGNYQVFYPEDNGREGLYANLIAVEIKLIPGFSSGQLWQPWVVRLPAAIAGVLTVLGMYFLAAALFGEGPGLLAAFLLATSFWHILFSRIGFRGILTPLLLVWGLYILIKALRVSAPRRGLWCAVLAGIVYGLGFYSYIAYRVTPLLFLLLLLPSFRTRPGFWKRMLVFALVTIVVVAPLGWYFISHVGSFFGRTGEISITKSAHPWHDLFVNIWHTLLMFNFHGDYNWRQNISGAPELLWPVGILFALGVVLGIYFLVRRVLAQRSHKNGVAPDDNGESGDSILSGILSGIFPGFGTALLLAWMVVGSLPEIFSNEGIPHALRAILMLPPAIMLAALGGTWLYRIIKKYWNVNAARALAVMLFVTVIVFAYSDYFITWAGNPNVPAAFNENYVRTAQEINALPIRTPKYVIVGAGDVFARGVPVFAQTVMFLTHSFVTADAAAKNIHYLLPAQVDKGAIPKGTPTSEIFYVD